MNKAKRLFSLTIAFVMIIGISTSAYATQSETKAYSDTVISDLSALTAPNIYLGETKTDKMIYSKSADEKIAPASLTKIVTALVCADKLKKETEITVSSSALSSFKDGYIVSGLVAGEQVTVDELLHLLLIPSMNDAGVILAQAVSGNTENFAVLMNEKVKELGCTSSNFVTPYGEDNPNHYTTAKDMYLIAEEYIKNAYLMCISSSDGYTLPATNKNNSQRHYDATNELLSKGSSHYYSLARGVKTGHTSGAGDCLISSVNDGEENYIAVVMGAEDSDGRRFSECKTLLEYAKNNFSYDSIIKKGDTAVSVGVSKKASVDAVYKEGLNMFLMNNEKNATPKITIDNSVNKAKKGDKIGTAEITIANQKISIDLLAGNDAPFDFTPLIIAITIAVLLIGAIIIILIINKNKPKPIEKKSISQNKPNPNSTDYFDEI